MKKIQPFTIGTKLSVPNGGKCQDFVDITLPAPALDDSMHRGNMNDRVSLSHGHTQSTEFSPTATQDSFEDQRDSVSPTSPSRSIRKIAICGSTEMEGDCAGINLCSSTHEPNKRKSSEKYIERKCVDKSFPLLETEPWRKMKNLQCDYKIPPFPLEQPGHASVSQEQDCKNSENSLIQLMTSPDLWKDKEEGVLKSSSAEGLDTCVWRHSMGEQTDQTCVKIRSVFQDQQDVVLALDVSAFYQHADNIINFINNKVRRSTLLVTNVQNGDKREKEMRKISRQIKMLNECAAWLSTLHPTLASRVARKQAEVQESWEVVQDAARSHGSLGGGDAQTTAARNPAEPDLHGVVEKHDKEEQDCLQGSESQSLLETNTCVTCGEDGGSAAYSYQHRSSENEEFLDQMEVLWEGLRKRYELVIEADQADKELHLTDDEVPQAVLELPHPPKNVEECSSGMLKKFLEFLDHKDSPALQNGSEVSECNEVFLGMPGDVNKTLSERVCSHNHGQSNQELLNLLSALTLRMNEHLSHCAELSLDILHTEAATPLLCDPAHCGVGRLQQQQDSLEANYRLIEREVEAMDVFVTTLQVLPGGKCDLLTGEVQSVLQIWEEVHRNMEENRERLAKFNQLLDYFASYLGLIAWTESTRSAMLSGSTAEQWKDTKAPEIDDGIEQKLLEFNKLSAAGQRLVEEGNYPEEIIKERTEELKDMLEWIQANWKTQREQQSQQKNLFVNMDPVKIEEMQSTEMNQQRQVASSVESSVEHPGLKVDFPGLVVQDQECIPAQTSLSSSICLILSFDEESSCISQVCKQPSLSSKEVHAEHSVSNKIQYHQLSINSSASLQLCNEPAISHSKDQSEYVQGNMKEQHSQVNYFTKCQHSQDTNPAHTHPSQTHQAHTQPSQTNPAHTQPSQDTIQMQQLDRTLNQTQKQQSLGNIQVEKQQSPVNKVQWQQSPSMIQIQPHQSPGNYLESPTDNKEQGREQQDREETATKHQQLSTTIPVFDSSKHQQLSTNIPVFDNSKHQQLSINIPVFDNLEFLLAEKKQLIGNNDQICLASPQNLDKLFISQGGKEKTSSNCGQSSSQLSLKSPDTNHQQPFGKGSQSTSNNQAKMPGNRVGPAERSAERSAEGSAEGPAEGPAEGTHRVTTYLHVTDIYKLTDRPSDMEERAESTMFSSPVSLPSSSTSLSHPSICGVVSPQSCVTPMASSVGLEQPTINTHRKHTAFSIVRCAHCTTSPHSFRERCNTWPEGRRGHQVNAELQGFMKNDSLHVICTAEQYPFTVWRDNLLSEEEIPSNPNSNVCPYLSIGSTLRVSFPQDFRVFCSSSSNVHSEPSSDSSGLIDSNNQPLLALKHIPQAEVEMQPVTVHSSLMQSDYETGHMLDQVLFSPVYEKNDQQPDKTQQRPHAERSPFELCHWEVQNFKQHASDEQYSEVKAPFIVDDHTTSSCSLLYSPSTSCKHKCLSVHTRIKDLNAHIYHSSRHLRWNSHINSALLEMKGHGQLAGRSLSSPKLKRVVVCGERGCEVCNAPSKEEPVGSAAAVDTDAGSTVPRLAHQQFLEDEEELEDIWKGKADDISLSCIMERGMGQKSSVSGVYT